MESVLDIVNPADKDGLKAINRAASTLERRIVASSWLAVLGGELRSRFLDRVQLAWRCGERVDRREHAARAAVVLDKAKAAAARVTEAQPLPRPRPFLR